MVDSFLFLEVFGLEWSGPELTKNRREKEMGNGESEGFDFKSQNLCGFGV